MRDPKILTLEYIAPPTGSGLSVPQCNELLDYAEATDSFDGLLEGRSLKDMRTMYKLLYTRYENINEEIKKPHNNNLIQISNINKCLAILDLLIVLREKAELGPPSFLNSIKMMLGSALKQLQNATKTVSGVLQEEAAKIKAASTPPTQNPNTGKKKSPFGR